MNKLADLLRIAKLRSNRPMGFTAHGPDPSTHRSLLIAVTGEEAYGADALIANVNLSDKTTLRKLASEHKKAVLGVDSPALSHTDAVAAEEAGIDFVISTVENTTADALTLSKLDYALRIDATLGEGELRALGSLHPLLIIVQAIETPLTLRHIVELRRIAMTSSTRLGAPVPAGIDVESLAALRDAGVAMLLLEKPTAEETNRLLNRISEMRNRPPREIANDTPTIPSATIDSEEGEEDDHMKDKQNSYYE